MKVLSTLGLQAMLYATDEINSDADLQKAMVGVASVWSVSASCIH